MMDLDEYLLTTQELIAEAYNVALDELEKDMGIQMTKLRDSSMAGGKMLRPMLVVLVNQACGGNIEDAVDYAVALQLVHSSSLVHDDILDNDTYRRTVPSLHTLIGIGAAILTGDAGMAKAINLVSKYGPKVTRISAVCLYSLCQGAVREALEFTKGAFDRDTYLTIVEGKTAALFATCTQVGAISANVGPALEESARCYGRDLGILFQLIDDTVDLLTSLKEGRPVGDLRDGKLTLPIFYTFGSTKNPALEVNDDVRRNLRRVDNELQHWRAKTLSYMRGFPQSEYLSLLERLPDFLMERMFAEKGVSESWHQLLENH